MNNNHIDMTATEIGYLWSTYQAQTLISCILTYFDRIVKDSNIKELNKATLHSSKENIGIIQQIFQKDSFPIPIGFNEADILPNEESLYTDSFILYFLWFINKGNINYGSSAINTIARDDIFNFYEKYTTHALHLLKESRQMLLSKGLWIRSPYIPIPKEVEFIKKESFINGWFGEKRPLAGIEIANIFYNILTNSIGLSLMNSFVQVTKKGEIHDYFKRGKEISEKHLNVLSELLEKENLPVPNSWNMGITSSTKSPFSEKLMLYLITFLNIQGLNNYGDAISIAIRRDIGVDFARLAAEVSKYGETGTNLLIKKGWMEAPPQAKKYVH